MKNKEKPKTRTKKEIKEKITEIEKIFSDMDEYIELYNEDTIVKTLKWVLGEIEFADILDD